MVSNTYAATRQVPEYKTHPIVESEVGVVGCPGFHGKPISSNQGGNL